jgi:Ca2+-binding EF-hand superfamily protein
MKLLTPIFTMLLLASPAIVYAQNYIAPQIDIDRIIPADTNHDGKITEVEMRAYRNSNFNKIDRNHDNFIDTKDIPKFASGQGSQTLKKMITANDANHDGRLSRDEYTKGRLIAFDLLDYNKDKIIDKAELNRAKEMQRKS